MKNIYKYKINYIYVFSNEMDFEDIGNSDCDIMGFKEKQSPFVISSIVNELNWSYAHQFQCKKTILLETNAENGNLSIDAEFSDLKDKCDYISFICGLDMSFK